MTGSVRGSRRAVRWLALVVPLLLLPWAPAGASTWAGPTVRSIAEGLDSPRGLDRRPGGGVFVAEAGRGGPGPCQVHPELGERCFGTTGAISRLAGEPLVNLPSHAPPDGSAALGPHDVAKRDGVLYATIGLAGDPAFRDGFGPAGSRLGTLVRWTHSGGVRVVADLAAYEEAHDPAGDGVDSNPFGVLRLEGSTVVTDAGGNSLLRVSDRGRVSTIAVFPNRDVPFDGGTFSMDAVPTTVVRGPDGAFYVGQLTGFPFPVRGARVYRVVPGHAPTIFARGFTNIIDIAFDRHGNLYVLEIAHNSLLAAEPAGAVIKVHTDGTKEVLLDEGLFFPGGIEVARGGRRLFVTNCGVCAGGGEILRIDL